MTKINYPDGSVRVPKSLQEELSSKYGSLEDLLWMELGISITKWKANEILYIPKSALRKRNGKEQS